MQKALSKIQNGLDCFNNFFIFHFEFYILHPFSNYKRISIPAVINLGNPTLIPCGLRDTM